MANEKNQDVDKLVEMVKDIKVCMLITNDTTDEGNLSGRPMGINTIDADGTMWFFTKNSSLKVDELKADKKVSIAIISETAHVYLMINGTASLVHDKSKMADLWNPTMDVWFPEGVKDSDIVLIKMMPQEVNYWSNNAPTTMVMFGKLPVYVAGEKKPEGEHGTMVL